MRALFFQQNRNTTRTILVDWKNRNPSFIRQSSYFFRLNSLFKLLVSFVKENHCRFLVLFSSRFSRRKFRSCSRWQPRLIKFNRLKSRSLFAVSSGGKRGRNNKVTRAWFRVWYLQRGYSHEFLTSFKKLSFIFNYQHKAQKAVSDNIPSRNKLFSSFQNFYARYFVNNDFLTKM